MENLPPEMLAVLTGFLSGLLSSIPVGPVNLTILNEGARRGLVWALLIGLGATFMEALYCGLAFTGFARSWIIFCFQLQVWRFCCFLS